MATIAVDTYLDGGVARTAGEAWTVNSGAKFTIRTDTRFHLNSPTSMTGSLGSITCNEGEVFIDATQVRWLAITGGSGTCSIGTTITQGGVSGYFLGYWASLTSAPSTTIGATGFIKLREVTGGAFAAGALTGIAATAAGADVAGWIEVVHDDAANITVPRLGKYTTRGQWFYLDNTTGARGQVIQVPTNGGGAATYVPAVWIESSPGSNNYDKVPALFSATNGWAKQHIGAAQGESDRRQSVVKSIGSGQIQIGEAETLTGTYVSVAAQASTYASLTRAGTYVLASNVCTVYCSAGHFLVDGQQTGLDFTTGTAPDGIYTATVLDPYYFTVSITAANTSGNVSSREGIAVTFTAHGCNVGESVYLDVTSGTGVDGTREIYAVTTTAIYWAKYPHTVALTAGAATAYHTLTITTSAVHNLAIGNRIYCDFTSGAGVDGAYTIKTVPSTTTLTINMPFTAAITTSNVSLKFDIGYVWASGCKVRIPNIIGMSCATGTRATNIAPHATITSRPEFAVTAAGAIDCEYLTAGNWYFNLLQPYSVSLKYTSTADSILLQECATAVWLEEVIVGGLTAQDLNILNFQSCFAGGTIKASSFPRTNAPGTTGHAVALYYNIGTTFDDCDFGIVQYARSTGYPLSINTCTNITFNNCRVYNGTISITTLCDNITFNNLDYNDRITGYTNATTPYYAFNIASSSNVTIDGVTFGLNGTVPNVHPYNGVVTYAASSNIKVRNVGIPSVPLSGGTWAPNLYALGTAVVEGAANANVKLQRIYFDRVRTGLLTGVNTNKGVIVESVFLKNQYQIGTHAIYGPVHADLNETVKGLSGNLTATGQASIYGTHFSQQFIGVNRNEFVLCCNEPTTETATYFTMVSGTAKYNSAGGILMGVVGNQAIWETSDWVKGYTAFQNITPLMSGGTIGNYLLEYALDTGSGYGAWKTMSAANLITETIAATGFKMKWRITTVTTNTVAITYLRIYMTSSWADMTGNTYPLDVNTLTFTGLPTGTDMVVLEAGTSNILYQVDSYGSTSIPYVYSGADTIDVGFIKPGYVPQYLRGLSISTTDSSIPISLTQDRNYTA
jgi:hypothetical protein